MQIDGTLAGMTGANAVTDGKMADAQQALHNKKLKEACKGFETMFLTLMYKQMRATVPKDELFGHSNTDEIIESYRDEALMEKVSDAGGIGLADMLYKQLKLEQSSLPGNVKLSPEVLAALRSGNKESK